MSGASTFREPERQAGGLLCCIPARPGVIGTTFVGMFSSGVLTSILWIEVANAQDFIPNAKAALISSAVVACGTFVVCLLGLIATVIRRFDILSIYAYATYATLLLQTGFLPWLVYEVVRGTDPALVGLPPLKVCQHDISVEQQAQCGTLLRESQAVIYTFVGLVWFTEVEAAVVVARYLLLLNRERRREAERQPVVYTSERNVTHTRVDAAPVGPEQQLLMPQPDVERDFDPYAEVGHSMPRSAHPGFAPEPVSSIPRYAPVPVDDYSRASLPRGAMGGASGQPSESPKLSDRVHPADVPLNETDAAPMSGVTQTTPESSHAFLFDDSQRASGSSTYSMPIANNATPPSVGHRPKDTPTLLERRMSRPLPPPPEFPQPSLAMASSQTLQPAGQPPSGPYASHSPPSSSYHDLPNGAPRPPPSSYPLPPPQFSAQLAAYASQLSPLPSSPTEDTRRSGYTWETQTPSSEAHTSGSSTETAGRLGYGGGVLTQERAAEEEQQRIAREELMLAWERQRRAWADAITEVPRSREDMEARSEEDAGPRWRTGPDAEASDRLNEPPRPLLRVRTPPAPRPLSIVHEERSDDAMTARYVAGS
ncbi:hypothetical protein HDZ31DRAFT_28784 [Schizophyllum fasciatum]